MTDRWIQTRSGRKFDLLNPQPSMFDVDDIATVLSRICRFGGHSIRFHSVAEHSCIVHDAAEDQHKLAALLHDASESYLVDVPTPIKQILGNGYRELEHRVMAAAASKFGFDWPLPAEIKLLDRRTLATEREQNMRRSPELDAAWNITVPPLEIVLRCWPPAQARAEFLERFRALRPAPIDLRTMLDDWRQLPRSL
jgi:uncharacterized protein